MALPFHATRELPLEPPACVRASRHATYRARRPLDAAREAARAELGTRSAAGILAGSALAGALLAGRLPAQPRFGGTVAPPSPAHATPTATAARPPRPFRIVPAAPASEDDGWRGHDRRLGYPIAPWSAPFAYWGFALGAYAPAAVYAPPTTPAAAPPPSPAVAPTPLVVHGVGAAGPEFAERRVGRTKVLEPLPARAGADAAVTAEVAGESLLRLAFAGGAVAPREVQLFTADGDRRVLASHTVRAAPFRALVALTPGVAYVGATATYADGVTLTATRPYPGTGAVRAVIRPPEE